MWGSPGSAEILLAVPRRRWASAALGKLRTANIRATAASPPTAAASLQPRSVAPAVRKQSRAAVDAERRSRLVGGFGAVTAFRGERQRAGGASRDPVSGEAEASSSERTTVYVGDE